MKPQIRILFYSILFFLYLSSTSALLSLAERLSTDPFKTLGCGFAVLNIIYAFFALKWNVLLNIVSSIAIAALALFSAMKFGDLHLFSNLDPYGIKTAIMANAVFSILLWEIVYQIKWKINSKI
ncbi:hypothetical protein [Flavobacterium sp.]|uniref:hypothetical protein n=1 Tax=Flavobacterium sp. TaxID=239 RepID=UPI00374DCA0F